ncbi:hypothetical protein P7996_15820, partial [Staphylococcus aureus]|nr:hypothetical protein [Staphylococcus aureus]
KIPSLSNIVASGIVLSVVVIFVKDQSDLSLYVFTIAIVTVLNALEKIPTCWYVPTKPRTTQEILVYKLSCPFGNKYANDER